MTRRRSARVERAASAMTLALRAATSGSVVAGVARAVGLADDHRHRVHGELVQFADDAQPAGLLGEREFEVDAIALRARPGRRLRARSARRARAPQNEEDERERPAAPRRPRRARWLKTIEFSSKPGVHVKSLSSEPVSARRRDYRSASGLLLGTHRPAAAAAALARSTSRRARYSFSSMSPCANRSARVVSAARPPGRHPSSRAHAVAHVAPRP